MREKNNSCNRGLTDL